MERRPGRWPALPYEEWKETAATLHMWTQVVGKIRMVQMPWINHSWHVTLYLTPRGLTTGPVPYGERTFQVTFDFHDHQLRIETCDDELRLVPLQDQTTADFYSSVMEALCDLDLRVRVYQRPNEVVTAIPFSEDHVHKSYDPEAAQRFWRVLLQAHRVFEQFRARFLGKSSPSHFFWGSFDLAVTRFSGRSAPAHPGGIPNLPDSVTREAYSHEVSSAGFWPGGDNVPFPLFYSYAYPTPAGFADAEILPTSAYWSPELGEFVLPYEEVRTSANPDGTLLEFLESTYQAAARLGGWDVHALEATGRR
jgi:hypothetical protein